MLSFVQNIPGKLFLTLSLLTGLVSAFINPVMIYFLIDELKTEPMYIGIYTVSLTLSGLVISQWLGALADKGLSSRKMYLLATTGMVLALLVYCNTHSFYLVVFAGVTLMAFGNAAMPQMLTISRQWAGNNNVNVETFNARIRACISLAWMMGPPLGYMLVGAYGFSSSFIIAIFFGLVSIAFVFFLVPEQKTNNSQNQQEEPTKAPLSFWFLALAITVGSTGNIMYASSLPLYTINELKLPSYAPGLLMGIVACIEIPVMLLSSKLSKKIAKKNLMIVGFAFGFSFYLGIFHATELWHFIALQLINAVFYGLYAGIGLTLLQEQLPKRIGFTSAIYSNGIKIGVMFGSTATGIIAQYHSFQTANLGAAIAAFSAIISMLAFSYFKSQEKKNLAHSSTINVPTILVNNS